jgi:hypothetical protein
LPNHRGQIIFSDVVTVEARYRNNAALPAHYTNVLTVTSARMSLQHKRFIDDGTQQQADKVTVFQTAQGIE